MEDFWNEPCKILSQIKLLSKKKQPHTSIVQQNLGKRIPKPIYWTEHNRIPYDSYKYTENKPSL